MRATVFYLRVLVTAALIASLGFVSVGQCHRADPQAAGRRVVRLDDHACACHAKSRHCCGKSQCQCDQSLPQQGKQSLIPGSYKDSDQLVASLPKLVTRVDREHASAPTAAPAQLVAVAASLVAQRTRLNI